MSTTKCKTVFKENVFDDTVSQYLYNKLCDEVKWVDGVRSRNGFTRKAYPVDHDSELFQDLLQYIETALLSLTETNYIILGIYLNYYQDGKMYTPNHSHKGTRQMVISLGESRTLMVGKKEYNTTNGSVIIFGSSVHGVPKSDTKNGRISIATFMVPY